MSGRFGGQDFGSQNEQKLHKFMNLNYPWMLKQRFPNFGTVISVADNEQDDVEMDYV